MSAPYNPKAMNRHQKRLVRTYALQRERANGNDVVRVRLIADGDARAYCADGDTYLIDPITVLLEEALRGCGGSGTIGAFGSIP